MDGVSFQGLGFVSSYSDPKEYACCLFDTYFGDPSLYTGLGLRIWGVMFRI